MTIEPSDARDVPHSLAKSAASDIFDGLLRWRLWGRMGWLEIRRRYSRTVIGPFWSAISLGMFVIALGSVGTGLWNRTADDYIPFLAAGFVVWVTVASIVSESCTVFLGKTGQVQLEYSLLVYSLLWRNLIAFAHNITLYVVVCLVFAPHFLQPFALLALPGLLLVMLNGGWIVLLFGLFALRFRDVTQFVSSLINVCMFVTPIFWSPNALSGVKQLVFVQLNPLYHLIDIVRGPLLGRWPAVESYLAVSGLAVIGWVVAYLVFSKFRKRISYWG
jgi:ABC-type polysaccharide/polyol phosphate export permease